MAAMSKRSIDDFLSGDPSSVSSTAISQLLLEPTKQALEDNAPESYTLAPSPGFCLKTSVCGSENGNKIFVNICTSELVLKPKDVTAEELRSILESNDPTKYRVPMSIGEPHKERDKSGKDCTAYDLVIHPHFYEKINSNQYFMEFFLMLLYDGLESKYKLKLNRKYIILKNRKSIGTLKLQQVRSTSTPVIMEMDNDEYSNEKDNIEVVKDIVSSHLDSGIKEVSTRNTSLSTVSTAKQPLVPQYSFVFSPDKKQPEYLVTEIKLPGILSTSDASLDIGEDCLVLRSAKHNYVLDIVLPVDILVGETGAQFDQYTQILTITMKVNPNR